MKIADKIKFVMNELNDVYCYNCRYQGGDEKIKEENCEDCHRKMIGWAISENTARKIVAKIISKGE